MNKTNIAWTDYAWNPITGCTAVSDGCKNCYAKAVHERFYDTPFSEIVFHEDRLREPSKVKKPAKIFVGSMTDIFQDGVDCKLIDKILKVVLENPRHIFIFLTKRAERMSEYFTDRTQYFEFLQMDNLWVGVTIENQKEANNRVPILLEIPLPKNSKRFVSIEPMFGEIDLKDLHTTSNQGTTSFSFDAIHGWKHLLSKYGRDNQKIPRIDWVIVGGETGAKIKVREMNPEWVQKIYRDCTIGFKEHQIPFFFKQWGAYKPKEKYDFEIVQQFPKTIN